MQKCCRMLLGSLFTLVFIAGCSSTSEKIEEQPANEASSEVSTNQNMVQPERTNKVTLDTVFYFDVDDSTLRPDAISIIKAHAERIKSASKVVRIEGHADERGTDDYNQDLGKRRAEAVRDLLLSMGVNSNKIETVSFGEKSPLAFGSSETAWQKNRRVELK